MTEIFADTFYFLALLNSRDEAFERTRAVTASQNSVLVTTAWVMTELADALRKPKMRAEFLDTFRMLRDDASTIIVGPEQRWFDAGIELYATRTDKDWSLTDCISFVVMRDRGIVAALTGDHHFEQAGFQAILK
jgi:uncharacterized protein